MAICNLCRHDVEFSTYRGRPDTQCPNCGSLTRHRRQARWVDGILDLRDPILHVAPNEALRNKLKGIGHYLSFDIRPEVQTDVVGDLRDMPFREGLFGLVVCSHVLEHIVEADLAIQECYRVTRPGGYLLVEVPYFDREETKAIPPDEIGHVWEPGRDWTDRYKEAGYEIQREHVSGTVLCRKSLT